MRRVHPRLHPDSLAYNFRVTAGLPVKGTPFDGWEHPGSELRGHFVARRPQTAFSPSPPSPRPPPLHSSPLQPQTTHNPPPNPPILLPQGHYLGAAAAAVVATGDPTLRANLESLLSALEDCQRAAKPGKEGYLSAFPDELIDRFEKQEPVWAPYYTVHKIIQARSTGERNAGALSPLPTHPLAPFL